ncbi:MAG: RHS repeat domain-containing protein [Terriglobia bacterium]
MLDHRPWPSLKEILPFFSFLLFSLLFAAPGFSQAADISYSYDSLGRLVRANFGPGNSQSYTYDAGGNRTSVQNDGGGGGTTPVLTQLDPSQIVAGGSGFTLQVNGNNFTADSIIRWNGSDRSTTFVSATQLKASISSSDIASPTSAQVTVYLGGTGGGTSNSLPFMVIDPAAALFSYISLNPTHVTAGDSSTGSVVLSKPAPTGGAVVTLASSDPTATVPVNVTVPAGGTSAVFSITTSAVSLSTAVKISGNYNGLNRTATLVVASPSGGGQLGTVFVPAVLSAAGLNNSFFTSEITFTNRGSGQAVMDFSYTAAFGGGSGTGSDVLSSGRQVIYSDAISYLKSLGIPIPDSGSRGGTLSIRVSGLSSPSDVGITVRTTTGVSQGRCGLAYPGIATSAGLQGASYVAGLRQNATDRSNVAVQNMGAEGDGDITLRVTVFSGDPNAAASQVLPDVVLPPGGFSQFSEILNSNGLSYSNGFVRVERMSGSAPYFAYGVINDQNNSDGSFVPPAVDSLLTGKSGMTIPVIVETGLYSSELVIANWSNVPRTVNLRM